nr:Xylose isomerase [Klebsiella pneumoniae]
MNATHQLGGENYVLWGGREGYETLLNTDLRQSVSRLAALCSWWWSISIKSALKARC